MVKKSFKFHEFLAQVEDVFVGRDLDAITLLITDSNGIQAKAHMSIEFMPTAKTKEENEELMFSAMLTHIFPHLWEIFSVSSEMNKQIMKDGLKVLTDSICAGKLTLPKERQDKFDMIKNLMETNPRGNA